MNESKFGFRNKRLRSIDQIEIRANERASNLVSAWMNGMGSVMDIAPVVGIELPSAGLYRRIVVVRGKHAQTAKYILRKTLIDSRKARRLAR